MGAERTLLRWEHEPEPEPSGERENRIGTARLFRDGRVDRRWVEEMDAFLPRFFDEHPLSRLTGATVSA